MLSSFFDTSANLSEIQKTKLKPIANLTPTSYLVIDPIGHYWYHTLPQLNDLDYSIKIDCIGNLDSDIFYSLCYCSDQTIGDNNLFGTSLAQEYIPTYIKGNILLIKYTKSDNKIIPIPFDDKDLEWITNKI